VFFYSFNIHKLSAAEPCCGILLCVDITLHCRPALGNSSLLSRQ